jgi:hypothetical protein
LRILYPQDGLAATAGSVIRHNRDVRPCAAARLTPPRRCGYGAAPFEQGDDVMVSATQQVTRIRHRKKVKSGKANKKERAHTPKFPIHTDEK